MGKWQNSTQCDSQSCLLQSEMMDSDLFEVRKQRGKRESFSVIVVCRRYAAVVIHSIHAIAV